MSNDTLTLDDINTEQAPDEIDNLLEILNKPAQIKDVLIPLPTRTREHLLYISSMAHKYTRDEHEVAEDNNGLTEIPESD